jgi:DNA-binding CsgD family transcriptional regulator
VRATPSEMEGDFERSGTEPAGPVSAKDSPYGSGALMKRTAGASRPGPARGRDLEARLRRLYSLTASEARVAILLTEGLSYAEAAERLGVSYHTVHTHVKAIHEKADVRSNGRLLALIRGMDGD